jgi:hypothetical protein
MTAARHIPPLLLLAMSLVIASASVSDAAGARTVGAGSPERPSGSESMGGWRLVHTRNPQGGADAVSIMHTADTSKSDLDLAGLMIRCAEGNVEVVIVLIQPLPFRARPHVGFGDSGNEASFEGTVVPPGTAILLPREATALATGKWQALSELMIRVEDGKNTIRGVVALSGLASAFKTLLASCPIP